MFSKIVNHRGFWKSVASLSLAFSLVFILIKWALSGFETSFFREGNPFRFFIGVILAGFVYGFFVTFGKFRSKLKKKDLL